MLFRSEVKVIYDQEKTNWKEFGGKDDSIILFRMDDLTNYFTEEQIGENFEHINQCISKVVDSIPGIVAFVGKKYIDKNFAGKILSVEKITVADFLFGKLWFPTSQPVAVMGALPLLLGTFWVSLFAILFALPFGLAAAIYMAEVANPVVRNILKPVIELLAGIPSVVYGFFGLVVVVPQIQKFFDLPVGETAFAGSIILGIMEIGRAHV